MNESGENHHELFITRHLRDRNDLATSGLDNDLEPNQEKKIEQIAEEIISHCLMSQRHEIVIYSSIKRRALETTDQIKRYLVEHATDIGVEVRKESALRELDQGDIILPDGFKDGDIFQPLTEAWGVFFKEAFTENNLAYRFGDPVMHKDGTAKYEQLRGHFSEYGESYAELTARIYDFLVSMSREMHSTAKEIEQVLVLHSTSYSIVRDLANIGRAIDQSMSRNIAFGTLVRKAWEEYQHKKSTRPDPDLGAAEVVDVSSLMKPEIVEILSIESDRMRAILTQLGQQSKPTNPKRL